MPFRFAISAPSRTGRGCTPSSMVMMVVTVHESEVSVHRVASLETRGGSVKFRCHSVCALDHECGVAWRFGGAGGPGTTVKGTGLSAEAKVLSPL